MTIDFAGLFGECFSLGFGITSFAAVVGMGIRGIKSIFKSCADVYGEF